jgi:hypothetical protein
MWYNTIPRTINGIMLLLMRFSVLGDDLLFSLWHRRHGSQIIRAAGFGSVWLHIIINQFDRN